jgi:putative DNA primase/helicase
VPISAAEAARLEREWRERQEARRLEEKQRREIRAAKAEVLVRRARPADPNHPYLVRKGVCAHGIGQIRDVLIAPLRDSADGRIWSVQFISRRGEKLPLLGARKVGLSHMIGEARDGHENGIAEGYATAGSVHAALGIPVAMAIYSGNLLPAAKSLRSRYPNSRILVAGDNDAALPLRRQPLHNVGVEAAVRAANEVGGKVSVPPSERTSLDWNDHASRHGRHATGAAIRRNAYWPADARDIA